MTTEKTTVEKMAELLLESSFGDVESKVNEKLDNLNTSFEARIDGLKTELQEKIKALECISHDTPLQINLGTVEMPKKKLVHSQFLKVLNILKSQKRIQKNIMMVGEAGSGKTQLACDIAEALKLKFYPMSVGLQTTKSDLLGFINAHGEYVTSPVREAFEKGGVLLLDEFDSTHAGVVTIINSLLANGHCSFPDKIIEKNKDFICLVACNTYGHGANIDYVGRNRLDGATLDRFIVVDVGYDKKLETSLTANKHWHKIIEQIRKNVQKQGIKLIISPRASMNGADLLDAGFSYDEVLDMCIFKGADVDVRTKCMEGVSLVSTVETKETENKYHTIEIRTEDANFDNIISAEVVNAIETMDNSQYFGDYNVHWGGTWVHQFTGKESIYFGRDGKHIFNSNDNNKAISECLIQLCLEENRGTKLVNGHYPLKFEFIGKGCRKPWKTIILEVA
jgi:predicted ATPase